MAVLSVGQAFLSYLIEMFSLTNMDCDHMTSDGTQ